MDSGYSALSESGSTSHLPRNQKTKKHASVSIQTQTGESGGYTLPVKVFTEHLTLSFTVFLCSFTNPFLFRENEIWGWYKFVRVVIEIQCVFERWEGWEKGLISNCRWLSLYVRRWSVTLPEKCSIPRRLFLAPRGENTLPWYWIFWPSAVSSLDPSKFWGNKKRKVGKNKNRKSKLDQPHFFIVKRELKWRKLQASLSNSIQSTGLPSRQYIKFIRDN